MHSVLTRLNALAAYTMSVLAGLTFLCFLSTFLFVDYQGRRLISMEFKPGFLSISNHKSVLIQSVFCEVSTKIAIDWFLSQTAARADINTVNVVVKHVPDFSASREKVRETTMIVGL